MLLCCTQSKSKHIWCVETSNKFMLYHSIERYITEDERAHSQMALSFHAALPEVCPLVV